ncbi:plasma membrane calcium-transporting ATPase [Striga asiatica]|uniref:Plasma membrane calcium-transporting ATPase n=1 Tax=Striga asiatica TaxID=4170 RepID=A0A5A7Q7E6_STRAF|nr:plasma membrane calcium-transporting ATPase [Striga asiatica]
MCENYGAYHKIVEEALFLSLKDYEMALYQVTVLLVLNLGGRRIINLQHDTVAHAFRVRNTLIFNVFVFCQSSAHALASTLDGEVVAFHLSRRELIRGTINELSELLTHTSRRGARRAAASQLPHAAATHAEPLTGLQRDLFSRHAEDSRAATLSVSHAASHPAAPLTDGQSTQTSLGVTLRRASRRGTSTSSRRVRDCDTLHAATSSRGTAAPGLLKFRNVIRY